MGVSSIISRSCDLNKPLIKETLDHLLVMGDENGDRFNIAISNGSAPVDLTGASVTGYFMLLESGKKPEDCYTVTIPGSFEKNIASITLNNNCYVLPCRFVFTIKVTLQGVTNSVYMAEGAITRSMTDIPLSTKTAKDLIIIDHDRIEIPPGAYTKKITIWLNANGAFSWDPFNFEQDYISPDDTVSRVD